MKINDLKVDWKLTDWTIQNDTHWITLTYQSDVELLKVEVLTDWMTEIFGNQQNIVKVKSGKEQRNARLGSEKSSVEFMLNG